jgi:phytoene desaturase
MSKLIVIGAGVAGLSTAVHAARNGYEVEVFEHHSAPGGVCTAWERSGYRIEGCIHWLVGATPNHPMWRLYEEIGATRGVEFRPVTQFVRMVDEPSGLELNITADLDDLLAQVEAISPADKPVFREIVDAGREHDLMSALPIDAPELTSIWTWLATAWKARRDLLFMATHRASMTEMKSRVRHPVLRDFLGRLFPDIPFSFATTVLGELSRGTLGTVNGGSHRFSEAIASKLAELGGKIRYQHDVEEILIEHDRAVGVRTTDGEQHRADRVVSCAPGYTTIFRMLGGKYTDADVRRRYAQWATFQPIALVSFGARKIWRELPTSNQFHLREPLVVGHREITELNARNYAFDPSLAPAGGSVVQALVGTDFDLWHDLHHTPRRYEARKAELADNVLARLEPHAPGIREAVEVTDVATPYTFWRFARSHRGAYEGFMPTAESMGRHVSKTLPGLDRFHMAGQWVEPGGGIPPAVYSGRQVVQLICEDDGREFITGS